MHALERLAVFRTSPPFQNSDLFPVAQGEARDIYRAALAVLGYLAALLIVAGAARVMRGDLDA